MLPVMLNMALPDSKRAVCTHFRDQRNESSLESGVWSLESGVWSGATVNPYDP